LLLLALIGGAVAQATPNSAAPARSKNNGSKTLTKCGKLAACATCVKSGRSLTCTRCSGAAQLVDGRCECPAGYGRMGSRNTVRSSSSSSTARRGSSTRAGNGCSLCAPGFYSAMSRSVGSATCMRCPSADMALDAGSTTCFVRAGFYFSPSGNGGGEVLPCTGESLERRLCFEFFLHGDVKATATSFGRIVFHFRPVSGSHSPTHSSCWNNLITPTK
jgi:hypothetical protein